MKSGCREYTAVEKAGGDARGLDAGRERTWAVEGEDGDDITSVETQVELLLSLGTYL